MRKFVQISATETSECGPIIFAVADDGTAWSNSIPFGEWREMPPLPIGQSNTVRNSQ